MRIGMLADMYKPHISGITNHIELNKRHLEALGHEVFVFTFGGLDYQDEETNVVRSWGLKWGNTGYHFGLRYGKEARALLATMDIVHVHHPFLSGRLAVGACRPCRIPVVFTNHTRYDLYADAYASFVPKPVRMAYLRSYLTSFCRKVNLVISPSAGVQQVMQTWGVDAPIEVVPNGVDLAPFRRPAHPKVRAELGFSDRDVVFVYLGRLGPEKNLTFLLESFLAAARQVEHIGLLLIGGGPQREELEERVKAAGLERRVHFAGLVPYAQVPDYLALADVFATASVTEVHPLTVIEAMAAGLPVLGIVSPGVGDTVEDGVSGYLTSLEQPAFTERLVRLATQNEVRRAMSTQAQAAADRYDITRTCQVLLERYERLVVTR